MPLGGSTPLRSLPHAGRARWPRRAVAAASLVLAVHAPAQEPPRESGYVEEVETSLTLVDVLVVDEDGRPLRGLTLEDFIVRVDGAVHDIASLDDLCACEEAAPPASVSAAADGAPAPGSRGVDDGLAGRRAVTQAGGAGVDAPSDRVRYVLYFDYSQMQLDGRRRAVDEAKRWVSDVMRDTDEAMVVAYGSRLKHLTGFTSDKTRLARVIEDSYEDPALLEAYPSGYDLRLFECEHDDTKKSCEIHARDEYVHGSKSLRTLRLMMPELETVPGRKALLLFYQSGSLQPVALYPGAGGRALPIGDLLREGERLGAEANLARTTLYPVFVGPTVAQGAQALSRANAVNLGANLADHTGGTYSKGGGTIETVLRRAGRECCYYRFGLRIPKADRSRTHGVRVELRGRNVPHLYRIAVLSERDRWHRSAQRALLLGRDSDEIRVRAALVPVAPGEDGWAVAVEVSIDLDTIGTLPEGQKLRAEWGVGALVESRRASSRRAPVFEDMERFTAVRLAPGDRDGKTALHGATLTLPAGRHELAAYAGDVALRAFGGASAELALPDPQEGGTAGPVLLRAARGLFRLGLAPRAPGGSDDGSPTVVETSGRVPVGQGNLRRGDLVHAVTFVCGAGVARRASEYGGLVARGGGPLFRLGPPSIVEAGPCVRVEHEVDLGAAVLDDGAYEYVLVWREGTSSALGELRAPFAVSGAAPSWEPPASSNP